MKRVLLITNFCPFYRVKLFKILTEETPIQIVFYSRGQEKYWEQKNNQGGNFKDSIYLAADGAGKIKILWRLFKQLCRKDLKGIIQGFNGAPYIMLGFCVAKLRGLPYGLWTGMWYHPETFFHTLSRPLVNYIYRHIDYAVVYGTHVRDYLIAHGTPAEKIFIAQNTADNELYSKNPTPEEKEALIKELEIKDGIPTALFVGRFTEVKGLRYLLKALTLLKTPLHTVLIGHGEEKAWCEKVVAEHKLSVHFTDYVANEKLYAYYHLAEIVVMPSVSTKTVKEAWGLTVNEAMNQGCVVVASDAVGAAAGGLVEDGKTGFVVPEKNAEALAEALEKLCTDKALLQKMSAAAKEKIVGWDYQKMAEGFKEVCALLEEHA